MNIVFQKPSLPNILLYYITMKTIILFFKVSGVNLNGSVLLQTKMQYNLMSIYGRCII